jgi:hypothetical protein
MATKLAVEASAIAELAPNGVAIAAKDAQARKSRLFMARLFIMNATLQKWGT